MLADAARRPRVCFVAHFAHGALVGGTAGHIGGVERQTALMSRWFAAHGYAVSVVTWDEGQSNDRVVAGVRIVKLCRQEAGIPGLRFLHPRWTSLVRALQMADADLYYQNCAEYVTGQVALWCAWRGRRFIYSVANDGDCDPRLSSMTLREKVLYRYGLRRADAVVVQTRHQQRMLRKGFGRNSLLIRMPGYNMAIPPDALDRLGTPPRVLWIARVTRQKRPDRLLAVARACPELQFDLVGPSDGTTYARDVLAQASTMPNVTVHGPARAEQVRGFFGHARCLMSTSDWEGFPNTFLEAWSAGLPVVSTLDPDGLIGQFGLGAVAVEVPHLATALRQFTASRKDWETVSARVRQYFVDHHSVERILPRFEQLFVDLSSSKATARTPALVSAPPS